MSGWQCLPFPRKEQESSVPTTLYLLLARGAERRWPLAQGVEGQSALSGMSSSLHPLPLSPACTVYCRSSCV